MQGPEIESQIFLRILGIKKIQTKPNIVKKKLNIGDSRRCCRRSGGLSQADLVRSEVSVICYGTRQLFSSVHSDSCSYDQSGCSLVAIATAHDLTPLTSFWYVDLFCSGQQQSTKDAMYLCTIQQDFLYDFSTPKLRGCAEVHILLCLFCQ